jgi:hypothetical protein
MASRPMQNEPSGASNGSAMNGKAATQRDDELDGIGGESPPPLLSGSASPVTSPPYWLARHKRTASTVSQESVLPHGAITLQDNEDGPNAAISSASNRGEASANGVDHGRDRNRACWAKSVEIIDHVTVNGSATNIGAFVVWTVRVETLTVSRP